MNTKKIERIVTRTKQLREFNKKGILPITFHPDSLGKKIYDFLVDENNPLDNSLVTSLLNDDYKMKNIHFYTYLWVKNLNKLSPSVAQPVVEKKAVEKKAVEKKAVEKKAVEKITVEKKAVEKKPQRIEDEPMPYISRPMFGTTDVDVMQQMYDNNECVLIEGDTGSGKTHLAKHIATLNDSDYVRINLNGATTPEQLIGQLMPNTDPNIHSKFVWVDGHLTRMMKEGGVLVIDEINMASADILALFNSVTDDERKLVLTDNGGEHVYACKNFRLIATMNPSYEGTKELNDSLRSRFSVVELGYNESVEKKLKIDEKVRTLAKKLRDSEEITTPVATRALLRFMKQLTYNSGDKIARGIFINGFNEYERPVVTEMIKLVLDTKLDAVPQE